MRTEPGARRCAAGRCSPTRGSTRAPRSATTERRELGLTGLIPAGHMTLDEQVARVYAQYRRQTTDLARNVLLTEVHDRNEVLFYRLLTSHLSEMLPIVYTPDGRPGDRELQPRVPPAARRLPVGRPARADRDLAARARPRPGRGGPDRGHRRRGDPGHRRLGRRRHPHRGRQARRLHRGGRHRPEPGPAGHARRRHRPAEPARRPALHRQPAPPGARRRVRPRSSTRSSPPCSRLFPRALLHWEDIGVSNARRLLERYRDQLLTFNDDIQGTGAVNLAAVLAAVRATGIKLSDHRIVIFGAGHRGHRHRRPAVRRAGGRRAVGRGRPGPGSGRSTGTGC